MLAELASHIGLNGNFFCYRCETGGTKEHKMSVKGYNDLFRVCVNCPLSNVVHLRMLNSRAQHAMLRIRLSRPRSS